MKRVRSCFDLITDYYNIREAFLKAIKRKRKTREVILFCQNTEANLQKIRERLCAPFITWGAYKHFMIHDPKTRIISAAPIEDRIIHHAIMNVLESVFERQMVFHSYACRKNKGTHAAVKYAFGRCKGSSHFLKLDIRHYFDSINHDVLYGFLGRIIKDERTLALLRGIIDSYSVTENTGLPIGNLTSQFFANLYLSPLDHYILEMLKPAAYVRYMDDFVLFSNSAAELKSALQMIRVFARVNLKIELKEPVAGSTSCGLPFLGFMIKRSGIYLLAKSKRRIKRRIAEIRFELDAGLISEREAAERVISVYSAVLLARTRPFRVGLWYGRRFGLEPRDAGRQLEQQREQLQGCLTQQQQPQQQEQQYRVPRGCLSLNSVVEGV